MRARSAGWSRRSFARILVKIAQERNVANSFGFWMSLALTLIEFAWLIAWIKLRFRTLPKVLRTFALHRTCGFCVVLKGKQSSQNFVQSSQNFCPKFSEPCPELSELRSAVCLRTCSTLSASGSGGEGLWKQTYFGNAPSPQVHAFLVRLVLLFSLGLPGGFHPISSRSATWWPPFNLIYARLYDSSK